MRYKKYHVYLTEEEKEYLKQIVKKGKAPARQIQRAHILLKADVSEGAGWTDQQIREIFHLARNTVSKIRKHGERSAEQLSVNCAVGVLCFDTMNKMNRMGNDMVTEDGNSLFRVGHHRSFFLLYVH